LWRCSADGCDVATSLFFGCDDPFLWIAVTAKSSGNVVMLSIKWVIRYFSVKELSLSSPFFE